MTREQALQTELEQVKSLNSTVDLLLEATRKTRNDIASSREATDNTSALLGDWVRILNQTKFVHNSLRNPEWTGVEEAALNVEIDALSQQETHLEAELLALEAENESLDRGGFGRLSPEKSEKGEKSAKRVKI